MIRRTFLLFFFVSALFAQMRLEITRATYGAGQMQADVTDRVRSYVVNGNGLHIQVLPDILGGDPLPGTRKTLTIDYRIGIFGRTARATDGEFVRLGNVPAQPSTPPVTLRVVRAQYGEGARRRDVTEILNSRITGNRLDVPVNNESLGGDPAPATRKNILVEYQFESRTYTVTIPEGQTLTLPAPDAAPAAPQGQALRITRASYGANRRTRDVTQALNQRILNDALELVVNGETLGGDPAPGTVKTLDVEYTLGGAPGRISVRDLETLRLPVATPLQIITAAYGVRGRTLDAAPALRSRISNNTLEITVDGQSLGGDPAPGVVKTLSVEYERNGIRYRVSARDSEVLRIPQ